MDFNCSHLTTIEISLNELFLQCLLMLNIFASPNQFVDSFMSYWREVNILLTT